MVILDFKILKKFAKENNIIAGACHAAPICPERLTASPFVPFVSKTLEKRVNPAATLPGIKSVIVIGVGWSCVGGSERSGGGRLSSLGVNADYHARVKELLRKLAANLSEAGEFKSKILVDGPGLDERALAVRAGLGFYGRNGLIISEKFGSRFNIGCLLTTLELPPGVPPEVLPNCPPSCNRCIAVCPTGALQNGGGLNAARCVSFLTQKDTLTAGEEKLLAGAGQLYGCDICLDACPYNEKAAPSGVYIDPREWLAMSDRDFQEKYGHTAMLWRGTEILRRNARLVAER